MSSSNSSSGVTATTVNGTTRVAGLTSGIDVDSIVKQLVTAEKSKKLGKLQQQEQLVKWRQDAYQDVIAGVQDFANKYFNLTSDSSLLSAKNFKKFTVTSSNAAVTATYTNAARPGSHSVAVSRLATAATMASYGLSPDVVGGQAANYDSLSGKSLAITVDGAKYTVDLSAVTDLTSLQTAVNNAVGNYKLTVGANKNGYLTITAAGSGVDAITLSAPTSGTSGLADLGFAAPGAVTANRLDTKTTTLADIAASSRYKGQFSFDPDSAVSLTINGVSFNFDSSTTIDEMIDEINHSKCGSTLNYDESTGELAFTATTTGAGDRLAISENGSTFLSTVMTDAAQGTDAVLTVDGQTLTRSSNTITVNGVTYTLNGITDANGDGFTDAGENATVNLSQDTDGTYDLITGFVKDYNTLIGGINEKLSEKYDRNYAPLTDDQKKEMSEEEIKKWEEKAKTGLLEKDSTLTSFLTELRSSLVNSITGVDASIFDIGLDTGSYGEKGKLVVNDAALKNAIATDASGVMSLFTKESSQYSGTSSVRSLGSAALSTRYGEEGLAFRFYDIIAKYTSTLKDGSGNKGKLVQIAGLANTSAASDNNLSKQLTKYQEEITEEKDRLDSYEEKLYNQYTSLETYINNMNTQLTALQSFMNSR